VPTPGVVSAIVAAWSSPAQRKPASQSIVAACCTLSAAYAVARDRWKCSLVASRFASQPLIDEVSEQSASDAPLRLATSSASGVGTSRLRSPPADVPAVMP